MTPDEVITFWHVPETRKRWFKSTPEFDQLLKDKFEPLLKSAIAGQLDDWRDSATGCLALCILLDQVPRNIYRGKSTAFATDEHAVEVCKHAIDTNLYRELDADRSRFLFMPLMHSEDLDDQQLSIEMFAEAGLEEQSEFANHHSQIIKKFGRFPHRNQVLGRESSAAELEYLNSDSAFDGNQNNKD